MFKAHPIEHILHPRAQSVEHTATHRQHFFVVTVASGLPASHVVYAAVKNLRSLIAFFFSTRHAAQFASVSICPAWWLIVFHEALLDVFSDATHGQ